MIPPNKSHASVQEPASPIFRQDAVVPDNYLGNLLIFFIIFIGLGLVIARIVSRKLPAHWLPTFSNQGVDSIVTRTKRLSVNANLHFVKYQDLSIVVAESNKGISIHILPDSFVCNESNVDNDESHYYPPYDKSESR